MLRNMPVHAIGTEKRSALRDHCRGREILPETSRRDRLTWRRCILRRIKIVAENGDGRSSLPC